MAMTDFPVISRPSLNAPGEGMSCGVGADPVTSDAHGARSDVGLPAPAGPRLSGDSLSLYMGHWGEVASGVALARGPARVPGAA